MPMTYYFISDLHIGGDEALGVCDYEAELIEFLEKVGPPGTFRILTPDDPLTTRFAGYGIASLGGYHAAKPRLFQDFADLTAANASRAGAGQLRR